MWAYIYENFFLERDRNGGHYETLQSAKREIPEIPEKRREVAAQPRSAVSPIGTLRSGSDLHGVLWLAIAMETSW